MIAKQNKPLIFATDLRWSGDGRGIVSSHSTYHSVIITTYPDAIVTENEWSAEHLFLSSVTTSFLSTYIDLVKKMKFENAGFECTATGQVELVDGKFKFTFIHIYPKAYVMSVADIENAQIALVKAKKTCPIFNSINAEIVLHPEVVVTKNKTDPSAKKH